MAGQVGPLTEFYYLDGPDTVFLYEDATGIERIGASKSIENNLFLDPLDPPNQINVQLLSESKEINEELYGFNVTGMLDENTLPYEEGEPGVDWTTTTALQWGWLSDLAPKVLRFPSGSLSKFMHLMHDVETGAPSQGYGYDLTEIIRYFDWTDGEMNCIDTEAEIETQNFEDNAEDWALWMDNNLRDLFDNYIVKWNLQKTLPAGTNYLNDFLKLVKLIEDNNPTLTVDFIVCLNIVSEPAPECKAIIEYMESNAIYSVTVAGVEIDNETYVDFFCKTLGFEHFDNLEPDGITLGDGSGNYWDFINGVDYLNTTAQANLEMVLSPAMLEQDLAGNNIGHNYIKYFKGLTHFTTKVGLVAAPVEGTLLIARAQSATCIDKLEWNEDLYRHYDDIIAVSGIGSRRKFDAIILHMYYTSNDWEDIFNLNLDESYPCVTLVDDEWQFDEYDIRLRNAFDGFIGITNLPGNIKELIKTGYTNSYNDYSAIFHFEETYAEGGKELWVTEWNLAADEGGIDQRIFASITGFTHGVLTLEWWLKNVKINFLSPFRANFFTYSTVQNYAGGSGDLLVGADLPIELVDEAIAYPDIDDVGSPYLTDKPFYKKKVSYFTFELLSEITKNNLLLLKSNTVKSITNPNNPPTVFVDPAFTTLYIYYTNTSEESQCYRLATNYFDDLWPGESIVFGDATITCVDASQAYSTTGFNALYKLNECYDLTNPYPIEIKGITYNMENLAVCPNIGALEKISVPAYSYGYIKITFTHSMRSVISQYVLSPQNCTLNPNPSGDYFSLNFDNITNYDEQYAVSIYTISGTELIKTYTKGLEPIIISTLPSGIYNVKISNASGFEIVKSLVKI